MHKELIKFHYVILVYSPRTVHYFYLLFNCSSLLPVFQVKVMHKQLLLFHNAISAYFSGNHTALEATLKQFNIKLKMPNADPPSWLEQ